MLPSGKYLLSRAKFEQGWIGAQESPQEAIRGRTRVLPAAGVGTPGGPGPGGKKHTKRPLLQMRATKTTITENRATREHPRGRREHPGRQTGQKSGPAPPRARGAGEGPAGRQSSLKAWPAYSEESRPAPCCPAEPGAAGDPAGTTPPPTEVGALLPGCKTDGILWHQRSILRECRRRDGRMGRVEYTHTAEKFFGELRGDNAKYIRKIMDKADYCLDEHLFDYDSRCNKKARGRKQVHTGCT